MAKAPCRSQRSVAALAFCLGLAGCGDAARPIEPVSADGSMMLLLVLDPDTTVQPVLVESIEPDLGWTDLRVDLYLDGEFAASRTPPPDTAFDALYPCILLYAIELGYTPRCPTLEVTLPPGAQYRVVVSATGRPTASAEGTVPQDFRIVSASARGDPPGTEGLEVHWTPSEGAWRYVLGVRTTSSRECISISDCVGDWLAVTADTVIRTTVPREAVEGLAGPWYVDVYAMERGLYEFLTTGTAGQFFSVPPAQNVEGGYGAVGAWVWRTAEITP